MLRSSCHRSTPTSARRASKPISTLKNEYLHTSGVRSTVARFSSYCFFFPAKQWQTILEKSSLVKQLSSWTENKNVAMQVVPSKTFNLILTWITVEISIDLSSGFVFGHTIPKSIARDYEKVLVTVESDGPNFRISCNVWLVLGVT